MNFNLETRNYKLKNKTGFSVIELLVICAIIATFSVVLILNFRSSPKTRVARNQVATIIISDIRRVQSMAVAGSRYQGNVVCGYGIEYVSNVSYRLYTKPVPFAGPCSSVPTRNYDPAVDRIVETKNLTNSNMEIRSAFSDIFFEPPDPKTYINNNPALNGPTTVISIQLKGQTNCGGQSCTQITIYPSGQINLAN